MSRRALKVLIAENTEDDALLMLRHLRNAGYEPEWTRVQTAGDFEAALKAGDWELILSDYAMGGFTGLEALRIYRESKLDVPFFLISGSIGEERAADAMRNGANDYIMKDRMQRLGPAVVRELREAAGRRAAREADAEIQRLHLELKEKIDLLAQSAADLEQFSSAAAHDLREPLRTVISYTQLLLNRRPASSDPDELEFAGYIKGGVQRMRALIDGLLAYSAASKSANESARVTDAGSVALAALGKLRSMTEGRPGMVTIDTLPAVVAEPMELLEIFHNLISNALKYQRDGQQPSVHISAQEIADTIQFAVKDNGIGIKPEHYDRIFDLFSRLHGPEYSGVGAGLAVCKRLVERNGGRIWVESEPGVGSIFYFTLPAVRVGQTTAISV
jgi:signal transduction histidine kinase